KDDSGTPSGDVRGTLERLARNALDRATGGLASAALSSLGALGPVRILVTQADGEQIDWAFDRMGIGRDCRDLTEQTESLKAFVADAVRDAIEREQEAFDSAQQAGEEVLGDQPQMRPPTIDTTGTNAQAGAADAPGAADARSDFPVTGTGIAGAVGAAVAGAAVRAVHRGGDRADAAKPPHEVDEP